MIIIKIRMFMKLKTPKKKMHANMPKKYHSMSLKQFNTIKPVKKLCYSLFI